MEDAKKLKMLIVDDDKFLVDMYARKFSLSGYDVDTARSGSEALEKIGHEPIPEIFLVDLIMPQMDGFQLVCEIRKKDTAKNQIIIILSNLGQQDDIEKGLKCGADGYIIKASATPAEVVAKVEDIIKTKQK